MRESERLRRQVNRGNVNAIKWLRGCVECGSRTRLEFDHRDPELKVDNVSRLCCRSWSVIQTEIDKCDVRCRPCHEVRCSALDHWHYRRAAA